jgi:hypothetical protein
MITEKEFLKYFNSLKEYLEKINKLENVLHGLFQDSEFILSPYDLLSNYSEMLMDYFPKTKETQKENDWNDIDWLLYEGGGECKITDKTGGIYTILINDGPSLYKALKFQEEAQ